MEIMSSTPPSTVSISSMKRVPMSHKWIFHRAGTRLRNSPLEKHPSFECDVFSLTTPPRENYTRKQTSRWYMSLNRTGGSNGGCFFDLSLIYDSSDEFDDSIIMIEKCEFSFLHPETGDRITFTRPRGYEKVSFKVMLNEEPHEVCYAHRVPWNRGIIINNTLVIQLHATVLCVSSDPAQEKYLVPLDEIRSEMHRLYKDEVLTDAIVRCEGKDFKVHKAFLASQSPVFKNMLEVSMEGGESSVIEMSDTSLAVVSDLVDYFYKGKAPNIKTLARDLLNLAKKYKLRQLFTICENELKKEIEIDNALDILILADSHEADELKEACLSFIHLNSNFAELQKTDKWNHLKEEHPGLVSKVIKA